MHELLWILGYFLISLVLTSIKAWRLGMHRQRTHGQQEPVSDCRHWACQDGREALIVMFVLWPLTGAMDLLTAWFGLMTKGGYLFKGFDLNEAEAEEGETKKAKKRQV